MPSRQARLILPALLALSLAACAQASSSSAPASAPAPAGASPSVRPTTSTSTTPAPYAGADAVIEVAAGPRGVAHAAGSIWVASTIGNVVQRVDPLSTQVTDEIRLDRPVTLVTVGDELWVSVLNADPAGDDQVVRIDTQANEVASAVDVPVFHNIAAGAGAIWAADGLGELRRVDRASGDATSAGSVGAMTIGIAANDTAVWGIRDDGALWRLPVGGGPLQEAPMGVSVPGRSRVGVAPGGGGSVWVAVPGTVLALETEDLTVLTELALPGLELVNDLWVTDTDVWLSANVTDADLGLDGGAVLRLDPLTAEVTATFPLGPESSGVVVADGAVWAVDQRDNVLARFPLVE